MATVSAMKAPLRLPPTSLSLDPRIVNAQELSALLAATGQNCMQFPDLSDGRPVHPAPPQRLRVALRNSTVVVSIHVKGNIQGEDYANLSESDDCRSTFDSTGQWHWNNPFHNTTRRLVAFGRATSDCALTASIHDLAVAPSLQRRGLGRKVLHRIVRELGRRGIYDIAALTTAEQRSFFIACGFAEDILQSTAMLYTRSTNLESSSKVFGRKCLLVPSALKTRTSVAD